MNKKLYFITDKILVLKLLAVFILLVTIFGLFSQENNNVSASTQSAPVVIIQYGDAAGDSSPNLPQQCEDQLNIPAGPSTYDNIDPDCLRVQVTSPAQVKFTDDFRFCLIYTAPNRYPVTTCTGWASEIGSISSVSAMTPGQNGGNLRGTMTAQIQTRPITTNLPQGSTFGNVEFGVALAYQNNNGPCLQSSGLNWSSQQNGNWSGWSYGAQRDDDPGCFQAAMKVGEVNSPPNAEYISTNIPQNSSPGVNNNNYKIVMKNTGMPWLLSNSDIVRPLDGHCNEGNFDYSSPTAVCTDYVIYSSQRYRLQRTDDSLVEVRSKELRPNSNDVTYFDGNYAYSGPDTTIPKFSNYSQVTKSNTIPFIVKQEQTFRRYQGEYEICVPGGPNPDPGGGGGPIMPMQTALKMIKEFLGIKTAHASYPDPGGSGDLCTIFEYDYILPTYDNYVVDITSGEMADFVPINLTIPLGSQTHTLKFRMVDLLNLNQSNQYYTNGRFGEEAIIPITVTDTSWSFSCDTQRVVVMGNNAVFSVFANVPQGYTSNINVTLQSSAPPGPVLANSPLVLSPSNPIPYTSLAQINSSSLSIGTYILTFSATDGVFAQTCVSRLIIMNPTVEVDIKFNDDDGPTSPDPADSDSGTLTWTVENADACTGSMLLGEDRFNWTGPQSADGESVNSFEVRDMQQGQTYEFKITCNNQTSFDEDSVTVTVMTTPQIPGATVDLRCASAGQYLLTQGPCIAQQGQSGILAWESSGASVCSIDQGVGSIPLISRGTTTGNLNTVGTIRFTISCFSVVKGVASATDYVDFIVTTPPIIIPPTPGVTATSQAIPCGEIRISWAPSDSPEPENYRVYHSTTSSTGPWEDVSGPLGANVYSFSHTPTGNSNYYAVRSFIGNTSSQYALATPAPVSPHVCQPSTSGSYKRVIGVGNSAPTLTEACGSETNIPLPAGLVYKAGDLVYFEICVKNTGSESLTGVQVIEPNAKDLNIEDITLMSSAGNCASGSGSGPYSINTSGAGRMNPGQVCSLIIRAKISTPTGSASSLLRFQNYATIVSNQVTREVRSLPEVFSLTAGVPNRRETAP